MSVRKKFDALGTNPRFEAENEDKQTAVEAKRTRVYAFRPAARKKDTRVYAVGFLRVYVLFAVSFAFAAVMFILQRQGAFDALNAVEKMCTFAVCEAAIYLLPAFVYAFGVSKKKNEIVAWHRFSPAYTTFVALSLLLCVAVEAAGKFSLAGFFSVTLPDAGERLILSDALLFPKIAVYVLVPAFCEELFFRGVLQTELARASGGLAAIVCTSVAGALMHFRLDGFAVYFALGLVFGVLRHVCGSCVPCVLVHAVARFVSLGFSAQLSFIASERAGGILVMAVLTLVLLTVLVFYLKSAELVCIKKAVSLEISKKSDGAELPESETYIRFYEKPLRMFAETGYTLHKFWRVLLSPAMIVAAIVFFLIILL